jgi:hypothetical protein
MLIDIALKARAFFIHRALARQRKNLEAARVRQHRPVPFHEVMDAAELLENLRPRTEQQMIRIGEQHARTGRLERLDRLALHRGLRTDRHENRRPHFAMKRLKPGRAGLGTGGFLF